MFIFLLEGLLSGSFFECFVVVLVLLVLVVLKVLLWFFLCFVVLLSISIVVIVFTSLKVLEDKYKEAIKGVFEKEISNGKNVIIEEV